jgi:hypothetical protein
VWYFICICELYTLLAAKYNDLRMYLFYVLIDTTFSRHFCMNAGLNETIP